MIQAWIGSLAGDRRQHLLAHAGQERLIGPGRLSHKVQQRLMLRRCSFRRSGRGQRFDALAALGRKQADTVILKRPDPVILQTSLSRLDTPARLPKRARERSPAAQPDANVSWAMATRL